VRLDGARYVLRCKRPKHCRSKNTPPPDPQALTGTWIFVATDASSTCPSDVDARLEHLTDSPIHLWERAPALLACRDYTNFFHGQLTEAGIDLEDKGQVETSSRVLYDFTQRVSGAVMPGGDVALTDRTEVSRDGQPTCGRTVRGFLLRADRGPCVRHADCIGNEPCSRCIDGSCRMQFPCEGILPREVLDILPAVAPR
jgi:hypothetical protein